MRTAPSDDRAGPPSPAYRFLDDQPPPLIPWLWPQRLPLSTLSLLIGDPAVGKSLLTADLAARLSVPLPWPDDPPAERPGPASRPSLPPDLPTPPPVLTQEAFDRSFPIIRGFRTREIAPTGVLFAAPEDQAVLTARLAAAGADLLRVSVLDGVRPPFTQDLLPLRLPAHADQLEEAIRAHDHPRLVVLDPIHLLFDAGVYCSPDLQTALLARLAAIARDYGVALLAVGHFAKTGARRILYRIRGSFSLVAAARSILMLTPDPDRPDRRILTQIKNSYGPLAPPLAFRIVDGPASAQSPPARPAVSASPFPVPALSGAEGSPLPVSPLSVSPLVPASPVVPASPLVPASPVVPASSVVPASPVVSASPLFCAPHLEWDDPARSDWRLSTGGLDLSPESFSVLSETCDWLTDFLSSGPRPAREVLAAARAAGIPRVTLLRAKRLLSISSRKIGPAWTWFPTPVDSEPVDSEPRPPGSDPPVSR